MRNIRLNLHRTRVLKCGERELRLGERTYIMGILNVTPDSFSDGGDFIDLDKAVSHAREMVEQGADIIDIGGESTRPGAAEVNEADELARVIPVIERLSRAVDVLISVDTYKANVAEQAIKAGAHIINDIWGMQKDADMASVVAKYGVPVVMMHNQKGNEYSRDIMEEICAFLKRSAEIGLKAGIDPDYMIIDPGIGFGKNPDQNMVVISRLGELNDLGYPILLGTSRKSMLGRILDLKPKERTEGTVATTVMGIIQGVDIVRVHDVKENYRAARVTDAIVRGAQNG